jgi:hypothetical protein
MHTVITAIWWAAGLKTVAATTVHIPAAPIGQPDALLAWSGEVAQAAEGLQQRCGHLMSELQSLRQGKSAQTQALDDGAPLEAPQMGLSLSVDILLNGFRGLEAPARETLVAMRTAAGLLKRTIETEQQALDWATEEALAELPEARSRLLVCLLGAAGKARGLLPPTEGEHFVETRIKHAHREREPLASVEALAIAEAETDSGDADVQFGLGLYWSDVGLSSAGNAAASSEASWLKDHGGVYAPAAIVRAEDFLRKGERATVSPTDRIDRAAARAFRLYRHAKLMAHLHHDAAVVWRYRIAAKLASMGRRSRLAAHSMTRLGHFLMLRGRDTEALNAVQEGLSLQKSASEGDPLAAVLQANLRRRLGHLRDQNDVVQAEAQFLAAAGHMPSPALEADRAAVHGELLAWRAVANTPAWSSSRIRRCADLGDVARVTMCFLCSLVFN